MKQLINSRNVEIEWSSEQTRPTAITSFA